MNGRVNSESGPAYRRASGKASGREKTGGSSRACIEDLQALSHQGLVDLGLFLLLGCAFFAIRQVDLLGPLTDDVRRILGAPPPPELTTLAMAGYTLSALILILARTIRGERPRLRWYHLGYRAVFFLFYAVAGCLEEHFMAVLVAGLLLTGLEQLNIWAYAHKALPAEKALGEKP